MRKDYMFTFGTEFLTMLSGLLVYRVAMELLGQSGFAEYALCRRTLAMSLPFVLLGLTVGIPRFIAISEFSEGNPSVMHFFWSGLVITVSLLTVELSFFNIYKVEMSSFFFGSPQYYWLITPLS